MACRTIRVEHKGELRKAFICGDGLEGTTICRVCGDMADRLCDYPIGNGKTCDSALCKYHSVKIKGDIDYCPEHSSEYGRVICLTRMENEGTGI